MLPVYKQLTDSLRAVVGMEFTQSDFRMLILLQGIGKLGGLALNLCESSPFAVYLVVRGLVGCRQTDLDGSCWSNLRPLPSELVSAQVCRQNEFLEHNCKSVIRGAAGSESEGPPGAQ